MKCNLDCDYCESGLYGGHDNSQVHPPLDQCLKTIDFMYEYVDKIMQRRITSLRNVVLNVYGGEALNHPDIVKILKAVKEKYLHYQNNWQLAVTMTTNAIAPIKKFQTIVELVDEFTVSWHSQNVEKHKQQFRDNILHIKSQNKRLKCIVMMHPKYFENSLQHIEWCKENNVKYLAKQIDHNSSVTEFNYDSKQIVWFKQTYNDRTYKSNLDFVPITDVTGRVDLAATGRSCCGGRQICLNQNYQQRESFVSNQFTDWYCSVDKFFLYVKQVNGEVYVNKDCKMNYNGKIGPIGNLNDTESMLNQIYITPVVRCAKSNCLCGICAPKAQNLDTYNQIMEKYLL